MIIKRMKSRNAWELCSDDGSVIVLVSFSTPIAAYVAETDMFYLDNEKYSKTTASHVSSWLAEHDAFNGKSWWSEEADKSRIVKVDNAFLRELVQDNDLDDRTQLDAKGVDLSGRWWPNRGYY